MPNNFVRVGIRWQEKNDVFEQLFNEQESCAIGVGNTGDDQVFLEQTFDGEECRIEATMRQLEELFAVLLSPDSREGPEKIIADSIENEIRIQLFPVGMSFRIRQEQNRILGVGDIRSLFRLSLNQSKRKSW